MSTLQIRHLPEDVFQALAFRADKEHRSLAQQAIVELRKLPEIEARKRRLQTLQDIESELTGAHTEHVLSVEPEALLREDRDR